MMLVTQTISDQKILSLPDGQTGPAPCTRTCSGVSSYKDTGTYKWITVDSGRVRKRTDIEECGFVSAPVVTAIMRGHYCPYIQVNAVSDTRLYFETVQGANVGLSASLIVFYQCEVFWSATGYTC